MYQQGDTVEVVRLLSVRKAYGKDRAQVLALDNVTAGFAGGTFTAVMGPSGSGKSTLLHCAAGLDKPTSGSVVLGGTDLSVMREVELTRLRRDRIGFVFQAFNLLPALDVEQNVTLPLRLAGRRPDPALVRRVIEQVGLGQRRRHRPAELSGGQQQRVAIARALVTHPEVIFADEPTGALDTRSAQEVLSLLREAKSVSRQTIVMVTHDPVAASYADRVLFLADGRVVDELRQPNPEEVARRMTNLVARAEQRPQEGPWLSELTR
ncbi:peptide ABC transporter ATPase [Amycolatopsis mediterranei S699]|uniref:ATPase component of ABC-type antimicrobial peptide transport system n=2 Tax=Amycolatopsis mediterranei TaxID=33910 RepID=A0A0H3D8D8_AMYMU|nr:ABC transporter ATP-binding protein [Amycolatopsis mediterranei]ADJ45804.1 ATPase component of ABC-type antimicrobial peptide transport system [Amycolatopsis mediterranei U32]AEK42585.1 peptide ABC transporter ATPase [Amycolatopsis mediterranei S699]AFO77515.1 peptide ABC transporter ATPase [Amycolatopsis mediterranei S699]AGT84643.1 peptide ABC transporter ATPase [Amycolatopsis mediterranei RB]KDO05339.1 ABC transporter [Amycolatopsis mediterranei]